MEMRFLILALCLWCGRRAVAQDEYGAKGIFPVYDVDDQWLIYDKTTAPGGSKALRPGGNFLLIGSAGANLFHVAHSSAAYGGACRSGKPARLRAALLKGPRKDIVTPILAVKVSGNFSFKGSHATFHALPNSVSESLYQSAGPALSAAIVEETSTGGFRFKADDAGAASFRSDPRPEKVMLKIDFASKVDVAGLAAPMVLVTSAQISNSYRRCLRLMDGDKLIGACLEMPNDLMAETGLLRFMSYDPGGKGAPLLLAYTADPPMWGHERWGISLRSNGPKLILRDAMDPRCREGF